MHHAQIDLFVKMATGQVRISEGSFAAGGAIGAGVGLSVGAITGAGVGAIISGAIFGGIAGAGVGLSTSLVLAEWSLIEPGILSRGQGALVDYATFASPLNGETLVVVAASPQALLMV